MASETAFGSARGRAELEAAAKRRLRRHRWVTRGSSAAMYGGKTLEKAE